MAWLLKIRNGFLPFWYRLTQIVLEKRLLNRCWCCIHCTGLVSDDLVSEDQFSEAVEKFSDLSLTKQQQGEDRKKLREQIEEQPSIVISGSGVCYFAVVYCWSKYVEIAWACFKKGDSDRVKVPRIRPTDRPKKTWSVVIRKIARLKNCASQMLLTIENGEKLKILYSNHKGE